MRAYGWVAAVAAAAIVAAGAAALSAPSAAQLIAPVDARPLDFFTEAQIDRGRDFRRPQIAIGLLGLAVQVALLAALARRPPRVLRALGHRARDAALAGVAISLAMHVIGLPFDAVLRQRARDVGLATQSWAGWAGDHALSAAINAVIAAIVAVVALALIRRLPRMWWLPGAAVVVAIAAALVFVRPIVLDPLFNRFEPLPRGPLRGDVLALARTAGIRVSEVYVMDASRRTTGANAYVAGLGATKRIVLYDTLVRDFPRAETRQIVAHELGHERYDDLRNGLLYVAIVAPFGMLAVAAMTRRLTAAREPAPAILPAVALSFLLVATGVSWISNSLSREVEARADAFALRATGDPATAIAMQRRLTINNVGDPAPPRIVTDVLGTHPPPMERIGMALRYRSDAG